MTATITFDKLAFVQQVRKIKSLKMTPKETELFAEAIEYAVTHSVATKVDLLEVKSTLKEDILKSENRLTTKIYALCFTLALLMIGLYLK